MLSEQQQRIMGYFIEEAKDHLNTIEQGLLNLKATIEDPEMVHEVFRAAHSVKGGAAMLGLTSIQHTAHRLEDYFKVLKECPVKIDQKLETLLLRVYDTLDDLLEHLQGPFGLTDDKAEEAMANVEPVFAELNQHLGQLVSQSGAQPPEDVNLAGTAVAQTQPAATDPRLAQVTTEESALRFIFQNDVPARLREMLQLFKQADSLDSRQHLQALCRSLAQSGEQLDIPAWCELLATTEQAIANPDNTYRTLAPVVIKEIKRAQEQVLAGDLTNITASQDLLVLVPQPLPIEMDFSSDAAFADLFSSEYEVEASEELFALEDGSSEDSTAEPVGLFSELDTELAESVDLADLSDFDESMMASTNNQTGPEVGMAELNTLADLFEGEDSNLGFAWQEEVIDSPTDHSTESLELDQSADFSDLLFQGGNELSLESTDEDLSGLLNSSAQSMPAEASLDSLFDLEDSGEVGQTEDSQGLDQLLAGLEPTFGSLDASGLDAADAASTDFQADYSDTPLFDLGSTESEEPPQALVDSSEDLGTPLFDLEPVDLEPEELPDFTLEFSDSAAPSEMAGLESALVGSEDSSEESFDLSGLGLGEEPELPAESEPENWQIADPWGEETLSGLSNLNLDLAASDQDLLADPFANLGGYESIDENSSEAELFTLDLEPDQQNASSADFSLDFSEVGSSDESEFSFIDSAMESSELPFDTELAESAEFSDLASDELDFALFGEAELPPDFGVENSAPTVSDSSSSEFSPSPIQNDASFDSDLNLFSNSADDSSGDSPTVEAAPAAEDLPTDLNDLFTADLTEASGTVEAVNLSSFELPEDFAEADSALTSNAASDLDDLFLSSDVVAADDELGGEPNTQLGNLAQPLELGQVPASEGENPFAESELEFGLFETDEDTELASEFTAPEFTLEAAPSTFDFDAISSEDANQVTDGLAETALTETDFNIDESEIAGLDLDFSSETAAVLPPELDEFSSVGAADPGTESLLEPDFQLGMEPGIESSIELDLTIDDQPEDDQPEDSLNQLNELAPDLELSLDQSFNESLNSSSSSDSDAGLGWGESISSESDHPFAANESNSSDPFDFSLETGVDAEQAGEMLDLLGEESDPDAFELDLLAQSDASTDTSMQLTEDAQVPELLLEDMGIANADIGFDSTDLNEAPSQEIYEFNQDFDPTIEFDVPGLMAADENFASSDLPISGAELEAAMPDTELSFDAPPDASEFAFEDTAAFTGMYGSEDNQPAPFDLLASAEADDSLNSLLAEEDVVEFGDISAEPAELDDLEAMLAEDSTSVTAIHDQSDATDAFDDDNDETTADFADLEALLDDRPELAPELTATEIPPTPAIGLEKSVDDEFGDLEALLQDADQTLGVGSSPARKSSVVSNRRPNRRSGLNEQTMRVSVKHLDNLNNLVGEMVVNRNSLEQAEERLRQFLDNLLYQVQQLSDVGQRMRDLYERSLLESSLLSSRRGQSGTTPISGFGLGQTNHATGLSFDALEMDRFTGFHTLSQEMIELIVRVRESASDIDFVVEETDQVTRNFRQITTQLQEGLTRSRMVPFAQTADRLPRGVRDNSLRYGKQAELLIEGRDTLIDKMIVEQLYDPMTHLVNNAIAHGIETPEERIAAGKPPTGRIIIRAFHQGNQTVISVSDDGAGINPEKVRAKALAKGLITPAQAREMSRLDTYDLLFHHGFSTVEQVDDLRGRGVGLDVVRSNLNEIRGTINIDSTVGKGTTFTIRLPLTLSISKALCCISNRARIAFPMDGVEDMLDVPQERIQIDEQGRQCIQWRDGLLPFQPLSELLRYNRVLGRGSVYGGNQEEDIISIVVLRSAGNFLALQVDQVLGEQEIVIKQLEGPIPKPLGVAGATVLGDGRIMPIADVLELIDLWQGRIRREAGSSLWDQGEAQVPVESATKTEPTVLIVDDSITVRELLSMTFSKVGYRVEQARDGQEAWEKLRSGLPCDLVFCDIEMPRMDGLELLSRIQKDANLNHLPIAMLTSRGADRHRQMAVQLGAKGYFTKPYLEEMLLDAAQRMLKGEVLVSSTNIQ